MDTEQTSIQRLPVRRLTLYKHGVGFFERQAPLSGETLRLTFRRDEINDVLKSLSVIDRGGGQILGMDYATPQSDEERLAGCTVRPAEERTLQDLIVDLRGRRVRVLLDQEEMLTGVMVGLDAVPERQPLASALVSVLCDETRRVRAVPLSRVQGVELLDDEAHDDLRFFLAAAVDSEETQTVTLRLTPGDHDLSVGYVAPAPTWRVSYRLVTEPDEEGGGEALLQGWGIFDNRLEEDLEDVTLTLVAGMPLSFVYDLVTPFVPERPVVEEEARVAPEPVSFAAKFSAGGPPPAAAPEADRTMREAGRIRDSIEATTAVQARGEAMGELFAYEVETPVSVGRGQTAMVPILSSGLIYEKVLLYNGQKLARHPVATLRFENESGLALERGPITVLEAGTYVGEAMLPFTPVGDEMSVPYAVELGVHVREAQDRKRVMHQLRLKGAYLLFEDWDVRWRTYQITNRTGDVSHLLIEHPRLAKYKLFDSPVPDEQTEGHVRFAITVPPGEETTLKVQERRLVRRKEELKDQSYKQLQRYMQGGLLDRATLDRLTKLLMLWDTLDNYAAKLEDLDTQREKQYRAQEQIRANLDALSQSGKEGALRAQYVNRLEQSEEVLQALAERESRLHADIGRVKQDIEQRLEAMGAS